MENSNQKDVQAHPRSANGRAEEEVYNISSPATGAHQPITFTNDDLRGLHLPHDDALVISANVQRILVDNGNFVDILFISVFNKMQIRLDKLHLFHTPLVGFWGNMTHPLGRPTLGGIKAIISTYHLMMKFPTLTGIGEMIPEMEVLRDEVEEVTLADPRETENTKPLEEGAPLFIHSNYPDRHVMIGTEQTEEL
ncbi:hypothetical protein Acr_00g0016790 [Actinidia rufa]|uniref:Uncharacterized protein n=1 Tax=Actinidia rufa TaxID=165716 RepID=A0A7J0DAZ6_9ERIC|nr:hypothetical protein Acr_00g0016790 [Actinidia rufa]